MGSPCPPHWSFAARAAYFGDRLCAFCDHRNPAGARFCNDCASPLHLKPCKACHAVDDESATGCHRCGAAYPVSSDPPDAVSVSPARDSGPGPAAPGDGSAAATAPHPLFGSYALQAGWRLLRSGEFVAAAIAMVLILGAYETYRVDLAQREAPQGASETVPAHRNDATAATPGVAVVRQSTPAESAGTAAAPVHGPASGAEARQPTLVRRVPSPAPPSAHARVHQRPARERQASALGTTPTHRLSHAGAAARLAPTHKARQADRWQIMQASIASCDGDVMTRFLCDQRMRRHFCEGYWGVAPECTSGVANEHGQ